ncbi:MAG: hypothetical protein ABT01_07245 [Clostridium sp. SCN 57-10]|nr:MAG: hypothetical protein ABT01_07245 [Clostridium sp. SCN 57-10]
MIRVAQGARRQKNAVLYDTFLSVDFSRAPSNLPPYYSPASVNMIRDEYGKVRRRTGYRAVARLGGAIHGITRFGDARIVHAGTRLVRLADSGETQTVFEGLAENPTQFWSYSGVLYLADGEELYAYDGEACAPAVGRVPRVLIAGSPSGAGTPFEQVNLLCSGWEQSFAGDGASKTYQLAFAGLDAAPVAVRRARLSDGNVIWDELAEGTHFTVDRALGRVTFTEAPSRPVVGQEDNLIITASRDRSALRRRVTRCACLLPFGVNGNENQLFATRSPDAPACLFWSAPGDITFWGDLQYAVLGDERSRAMALSPFDDLLAVHKEAGGTYLCEPFLTALSGVTTAQVRVTRVLAGSGCLAPRATASFGEPLFLSPLGVQSLTRRDVTGRECETRRGERIDSRLLREPEVKNAVSCVHGSYCLIAVPPDRVYVLDRLNPRASESNEYHDAQYHAFYWEHVPARCMLSDGDTLCFGTADGRVCEFYRDADDRMSYNDDGETYEWLWEFPEYTGALFYSSKSITSIALRARAALRASVSVDARVEGLWRELIEDSRGFGYFDLDDLDFTTLNLSTDTTPKKALHRQFARRLDKIAFRVRGNAINRPFGLYAFAFEVKEEGKHKGG